MLNVSCSDSHWDGEWGATVGDCDEQCTVYYSAQKELMKNWDVFDKDFPDKQERRQHITLTKTGYEINSWFRVVSHSDTIINQFSCEVIYEKEKIGYVVKNLKLKEPNLRSIFSKELESDTVTIELEYFGWGCPCPQWVTSDNKLKYESQKVKDTLIDSDLFWNVIPENDTLPNPFDLIDDFNNLTFEFKGRFYKEPQFLGEEGDLNAARTLLYHSVKHVK